MAKAKSNKKCVYVTDKNQPCGVKQRYIRFFPSLNQLAPACGRHDRMLGRKALMRLGWSLQNAISWEREPE